MAVNQKIKSNRYLRHGQQKIGYLMKQSLTFEGAGVTKAAFESEEKKAAIAESIAVQLGVGPTSVKIIQIKDLSGRRSRRRNLASTGIVVDYEVTVSDESLKDLAKTKMDTMTTGSSNATLTRITGSCCGSCWRGSVRCDSDGRSDSCGAGLSE